MPKFSRTCYVIRTMQYLSDISTLKRCLFSFHNGYDFIFWGNSPVSRKVFQLQKKIIRIMRGSTSRTSHKPLFRTLEILTMPSKYMLSLVSLFVDNLEYCTLNFSIQEINTRRRVQLYIS